MSTAELFDTGTDIVLYDKMCRAIDAAYEIDEVKNIRDKAIALEVYARQAQNREAERRATEIRLRAEHRAGQLRTAMVKAKAGRPKIGAMRDPISDRGAPTREDLGLTKRQDRDWQKLGRIPQEQFEAALSDPTRKPTTTGIIRDAERAPEMVPVSDDALWLWGRLNDFERMLVKDPADVLLTMTPAMRNGVYQMAPRVAAWLRRIGETLDGEETGQTG
jgi:hypothetical protein